MGLFNFTRPEPRKFNYKPRFYDPEKENIDPSDKMAHLKSQWERKRTQKRFSNQSLVFALVILGIIAYAIFSIKAETLGKLLEYFSR